MRPDLRNPTRSRTSSRTIVTVPAVPASPADSASVGTAVEVLGTPDGADATSSQAPVDPDVFRVGMAVIHPQYGPGKVAALSGQGAPAHGHDQLRHRRPEEDSC